MNRERVYQIALGGAGVLMLLLLVKLWRDGAIFDLTVDIDLLPDDVKDFLNRGKDQDEFDQQLADQARSVGLAGDAERLETAVEDDHTKDKDEWGQIAVAAVTGAIVVGFIAYAIGLGPLGIIVGILVGAGLAFLVMLGYVELDEKAERDAARGQILANMIGVGGSGPAVEVVD